MLSDRRARNWELHEGAEDGYEDPEMNDSSDSETNFPLAQISSGNRTNLIPMAGDRRSSHMKLTTGGDLFRTIKNRKIGDPYLIPVKEVIDALSDHTVTLKNGHFLENYDLSIKRKKLPGPCHPRIQSGQTLRRRRPVET